MKLSILKEKVNVLGPEFYYSRNEKTYNEIYHLLYDYFYNVLNKINYFNRNVDFLNEAVDDTLIQIYIKIDQYKPEYSFYNWAFTILLNRAGVIYRYYKITFNHKSLDNDDYHFVLKDDEDEETYMDQFPDNILEILYESIEKLIPKYRYIVYDKYILLLTHEELALKYDMNLSTMKTRLRTGHIQLLDILSKELGYKIKRKRFYDIACKHKTVKPVDFDKRSVAQKQAWETRRNKNKKL